MTLKRATLLLSIVIVVFAPVGCRSGEAERTDEPSSQTAADDGAERRPDPVVVEVTVEDFAFVAPPEVRSGWNTFRMKNEGEQPHFLLLWRLPEGAIFDDWATAVAQPFQQEYDRYTAGQVNATEMMAAIEGFLPEWFGEVQGMGGVGLTAAGRTAQATTLLEPGNYVMECYVLSDEAQFHGTLGMLRPLIVTTEATGMSAPEADVRITLSNYQMTIEGEPGAGEQTIAVHTTEDPEGLVGHDVHLARLDPETPIEEVVTWMSWVDEMRPPAPAEFLGGAEHVSAGRTGYFTVALEPGRYAWISEGYADKGMVQEFVIEGAGI